MQCVSRVRALLLLAALPPAAGAVWLVSRPLLLPAAPASLRDLLGCALSWALVVAAARVGLAAATLAAEGVLTGRIRHTGGSRTARLVVAGLCGLGALTVTGTAQASSPADPAYDGRHHEWSTTSPVEGLPLPDRVEGLPLAESATATATATEVATEVVMVRRGDCLWSIARAHGTTWQQVYAANRATVGDDPDLIHPGQELVLP